MKSKRNNTSVKSGLYIHQPAYPNAAEPRYFTDKMLNAFTTAVSAMGFVTAVVCLVAMA